MARMVSFKYTYVHIIQTHLVATSMQRLNDWRQASNLPGDPLLDALHASAQRLGLGGQSKEPGAQQWYEYN